MTGTVLVTGSRQGIGAALCRAFLEDNLEVIGVDRESPAETDARIVPVEVDLLDAAATAEAAATIAASHLVTTLIHNAGLVLPALVEEARPDQIAALTQLHLGAALALVQASLPAMKAAGQGRIVLISSRAALGVPTRTAYSASKSGMIGMARTWALELAPHGITVNVVAPGPIRTQNFWDIVPKGSEQERALAARLPVGRLGEVSDVVHAVRCFTAPEAGFLTGQVLYTCGGGSLGGLTL